MFYFWGFLCFLDEQISCLCLQNVFSFVLFMWIKILQNMYILVCIWHPNLYSTFRLVCWCSLYLLINVYNYGWTLYCTYWNTWCFSQDLLNVCRELNLEDSLEELMKELGADENGRISYKEFLRRRLALKPEIEALRSTPHLPRETVTPDYLPTSSDNSLGEL